MFYLIIILWIIIDLGTKYVAYFFLEENIFLVWNILFLWYVENTGIAFSIQIPSFFLKIWTIILTILIFYYYKDEKAKIDVNNKRKRYLLDISFWLILSGAIWNGFERVLYGRVIDFIGLKHFAVFNMADSFIFIGGVVYIFLLYKKNKLWVFDQEK